MHNSMPSYEVWNHRISLGYVSAVSYKQAMARAVKLWPNRRLQIDMAANVPPTDRDRLAANIACSRERTARPNRPL